jgi:hypothetical protein
MPYLTDDEIQDLANRAVAKALKGNPKAANQAAVNELVGQAERPDSISTGSYETNHAPDTFPAAFGAVTRFPNFGK